MWHSSSWLKTQNLPDLAYSWLMHHDSMTARMRSHYQKVSVTLLHQDWQTISEDEAHLLNISSNDEALVREVRMWGDEHYIMFGRCVFPKNTAEAFSTAINGLGTTPLGTFLFSHPNMRRSEFEFSFLTPKTSFYQKTLIEGNKESGYWARRSLFYLDDFPLLLQEVFLPTLLAQTWNEHAS